MLGSPQDAQDAVQDTLVRAWRGLGRFEDRAGLRPWLYRIATNVCLDMLKGRGRRALPMDLTLASSGRRWEPSHELALGIPRSEATWVQPIPDHLVSSPIGDPADVAGSRESIRLAFIAALQHLVPRQRAVLILRDVLSWRAHEVATLLETSEDAVNSILRRARSALEAVNIDAVPTEPTEADSELLYRYIDAFERYDVDSLVALLHEDATLCMPPYELWLRGIPDIRRFLAALKAAATGSSKSRPMAARRWLYTGPPAPRGRSNRSRSTYSRSRTVALLRSTPSSTRLYSQSSDSLRLPNRSAIRRFLHAVRLDRIALHLR
jgi:RNA polymerase sigma-70 factor (ECF subfamily)